VTNKVWIDKSGDWNPKHLYGYLNNWCLPLLQSLRAKHDIKLITNGEEMKDIAWYITKYVAKNQKESSNTLALLAKMFAYHHLDKRQTAELSHINK
jgi:hypothetical protein